MGNWVALEIPGWLGGGDPRRFLTDAGYEVRAVGGADRFRICTAEGYTQSKPNLVYSRDLHHQMNEIDRLASQETVPPVRFGGSFQAETTKIQRAAELGELAALADLTRVNLAAAESEGLREAVATGLSNIGQWRQPDGCPAFPQAGAFLVIRDTS